MNCKPLWIKALAQCLTCKLQIPGILSLGLNMVAVYITITILRKVLDLAPHRRLSFSL